MRSTSRALTEGRSLVLVPPRPPQPEERPCEPAASAAQACPAEDHSGNHVELDAEVRARLRSARAGDGDDPGDRRERAARGVEGEPPAADRDAGELRRTRARSDRV